MSHTDSGFRCLVCHFDANGNILPQCIICAKCNQSIRPENMNEDCPGAPKCDPKLEEIMKLSTSDDED
jgi:hypothetical protein